MKALNVFFLLECEWVYLYYFLLLHIHQVDFVISCSTFISPLSFNFVMILIRNEQRGLFAGFTFAQVTPDQ